MQTVRLGNSGLRVSQICLGTMTFGLQTDEHEARAIMDAAEGAGIDFLDVADVYPVGGTLETVGRTEEIVGRWLGSKRDRFVVATKVYGATGSGPNDSGLSRRHVIAACEASLRRLGTSWIDLYYIHRWDPATPIEETLAAFETLRAQAEVEPVKSLAAELGALHRSGPNILGAYLRNVRLALYDKAQQIFLEAGK